MLIEQPKRAPRVQFKHPVRVETMSEPRRVIRTLTANVSRDGLFLRMPEPLPTGTKLHVAIEAAGAPHALAEGEVCWGTRDGELAGCGVRFTKYAHPRSKELLSHLVDSLHHNRPLRVAPRPARWPRRAAFVAGLVVLLGLVGWVVAPAPAVAPVVVEPVVAVMPSPAPEQPAAQPMPAPIPAPTEVIAAAPSPEVPAAPVVTPPPARSRHRNKAVLTSARAAPKTVAPSLEEAMKGAPPAVPAQRFGTTMSVAGTQRGTVKLPVGAAPQLSWDVAGTSLRLTAGGDVTKAFFLASPPRAVFDIGGKAPAHTESVELPAPHSKGLRIGKLPTGTRLVVDLERAPKDAKVDGKSLVLTF